MISNQSSPPSYSFGQRYPQKTENLQVGPGSYDNNLQSHGARYTIAGRNNPSAHNSYVTPAPGQYNIPQKVVEHPGRSMGIRYSQVLKPAEPGPGQYSPDTKSYAAKYSFGQKLKNRDLEQQAFIPGPGNYSTEIGLKKLYQAPGVKIGLAQRASAGDQNTKFIPGPGAYQTDRLNTILQKSPGYKFGQANRQRAYTSMDAPGPGQYQYKSIIGKDGPAHSMIGSHANPLNHDERSPGPGSYSPDAKQILKRAASYAMGVKIKHEAGDAKFIPGPGQYDPDNSKNRNQSIKWKFGSAQRYGSADQRSSSPAPNSYQQKSYIGNDGPKHSMPGRNASVDSQGNHMPGPGAYNVDQSHKRVMARSPSFPMGVRLGHSNSQNSLGNSPGPGQYGSVDNSLARAMGAKMGKQRRFQEGGQQHTPAPGQYDIRGVIGQDGPRQSMGMRYSSDQKQLQDQSIPGPGQYSPQKRFSAPAYKMGQSPQRPNKILTDSPEPSRYNPNYEAVKNRSPGAKMGKDRRRPIYDDKNETPGPQNYTLQPVAVTGKGGAYIGQKLHDEQLLKARHSGPGPGAYSANNNSVLASQPKYSMKSKSDIKTYQSNDTPAPGQYSPQLNQVLQSAPKYALPKSNRFKYNYDTLPGPGSYKIPVAVAHLPQHQNTTNPQYKFV